MRIAIIHGYFLSDSGSAIYVRELSRELARQGHEVTLVCQEQEPEQYDFIDSAYQLDETNGQLRLLFGRETAGAGLCRLVRPHLGGKLLTYVAGPFPGFEAIPFQDAPGSLVDAYIEANCKALGAIFNSWPPDLVQANHAVMQPYLVRRVLGETVSPQAGPRAPYIVTIHGSALNFTVRQDGRMAPYALDGLEGATAVAALSGDSRTEIVEFARRAGLDIEDKSHILPPGVDTKIFHPGYDRGKTLADIGAGPAESGAESDEKSGRISADDDILTFTGRLLWTKGLHYAVAALPLIHRKRPRLRLLVAGDGPMRGPLLSLIDSLDAGDLTAAEELLSSTEELTAVEGFGPVLPPADTELRREYRSCLDTVRGNLKNRIYFLGHISHKQLAPLLAASDLLLAPSVFPEAFGMVAVEAMAAGALPLATYHSGLKDPMDAVSGELGEPLLKSLAPGCKLTESLAGAVVRLLESRFTGADEYRHILQELAGRLYSWEVLATRYLRFAASPG